MHTFGGDMMLAQRDYLALIFDSQTAHDNMQNLCVAERKAMYQSFTTIPCTFPLLLNIKRS